MLQGTAMDLVMLATTILFTTKGFSSIMHVGSGTSILQKVAYAVLMRHYGMSSRKEGQGT